MSTLFGLICFRAIPKSVSKMCVTIFKCYSEPSRAFHISFTTITFEHSWYDTCDLAVCFDFWDADIAIPAGRST